MRTDANDLTTVEVGDPLAIRGSVYDKGIPVSTTTVTRVTSTVVHTSDGNKWLRRNGNMSPKPKSWRIPFAERTGPRWDAIVEAERVMEADAKTIDKEIRQSYSWSRGLSYDQIHRIAEILRETP